MSGCDTRATVSLHCRRQNQFFAPVQRVPFIRLRQARIGLGDDDRVASRPQFRETRKNQWRARLAPLTVAGPLANSFQ